MEVRGPGRVALDVVLDPLAVQVNNRVAEDAVERQPDQLALRRGGRLEFFAVPGLVAAQAAAATAALVRLALDDEVCPTPL